MTRNPWSGLAPAVDAHLERWRIIRRIQAATKATVGGETEAERDRNARRALVQVADTDAGRRWLVFARSYGLPGTDGKPQPSFKLVDRDTGEEVEDLDEATAMRAQTATFGDGSTVSGREQFVDTGASLSTGLLLLQREYMMLDAATTHYVSAEVIDEVTFAAEESFPEPLFPTDMITPAGFAVLEKPLRIVDLHVDTGLPDPRVHTDIRAIGWHAHDGIRSPKDDTTGMGVTLFCYTTPRDYLDGYVEEAKAAYGRENDGWAEENDVEGPFMPLEVIPWRFGAEWEPRPDDIAFHIPGTVPSPVAYQRRWFFAFMRLCWQEIIVRRAEPVGRHEHRRWDRMAQRKELLDYTTLRLRRVVDPDYEPTGMGVPLDHRVKVRAHWRRQWIASLGPARLPDGTMDPATHRLVWIEAHWRGPEDGPIGALHSATVVTR